MSTVSSWSPSERTSPVAGEGLLSPWLLAAMGLLLVNNHWLKAHYGGAVTGKLSDIAGLAFFPAFLQALVEIASGRPQWRRSRFILVTATLATAVVFSAVKLSGVGAETYRVVVGVLSFPLQALGGWLDGQPPQAMARAHLVRDWTDLFALPAAMLPLLLDALRRRPPRRSRARQRLAAAFIVIAIGLLTTRGARAAFYSSIATGIGVVHASSTGRVDFSSPERAAVAGYAMSLSGVGPVLALTVAGRGDRMTTGALLELGWYRGHSWGTSDSLRSVEAAVDSRLFMWFLGPSVEVRLPSAVNALGFAIGFTGIYPGFEGAPVHSDSLPSAVGNALAFKLWVGGDFDVKLGRRLKLGWRCPVSFTWDNLHRLIDNPHDRAGAQTLQWLFDLSY